MESAKKQREEPNVKAQTTPPQSVEIRRSSSRKRMKDSKEKHESTNAIAKGKEGYKSPLSPIADLSRGGATSRASNAPSSFGSQSSTPVLPVNRKYNMNDSEISFLIKEVKILAKEEDRLLNSKSSSNVEQKAINMAKLEAERAELHDNLCAVCKKLDKYKGQLVAEGVVLAEADKKLSELERAKEDAEKTIKDYEFIVATQIRTYVKQKEDLHAKLIAQEEELEKCYAVIRSQADLTSTSEWLLAELAVANERLLESEAARVAAQKRCEELAEKVSCKTPMPTRRDSEVFSRSGKLSDLVEETGSTEVRKSPSRAVRSRIVSTSSSDSSSNISRTPTRRTPTQSATKSKHLDVETKGVWQ
uniref:RAB6-interacting golgin n=2 Tax=Haemonchus contortus TaxID=6289 RepID=A0A7I4Z6U2_HAECO